MQPETKILLDSYKKQFTNYLTYIKSNNWVFDNSDDSVIEKYTTENSLVSGVLNTLSKFKEDIQEDIELKPIQSFFEFSFNIVAIHINRVEDYLNENDWSKMFDIRISDINRLLQDYDDVGSKSDEDKEYIQQLKTDLKDIEGDKRKEIQFQNTLFQNITAHKVKKSKLKLDKDDIQRGSTELFFGDDNKAGKYVKAPLLMRKMLCDNIPLVKQKTELLELDFHAPSMNPTTSNEMLINMNPKDIPQWDTKKHFFEQEISTIQFWEEEIRKIKNGINIGGYFIHPFLYWQLNMFKAAIGSGLDKSPKNPDFRDNEYYFVEMVKKAENHGRCGILLYGTRRLGKSLLMTSWLQRIQYVIQNAQCKVLAGAKDPDIMAILGYMDESLTAMYPALKMNANSLNEHEIVFGLKGKKAQELYNYSQAIITNLESGSKKGSQKTAGGTPDGFIMDEIAKFDCLKAWNAAKPSFAGGEEGKWRVLPLLAATAGDSDLSTQAEKLVKDPEANDLLMMDWDMYENKIEDKNDITWKRTKFPFFVPAQLSLEAPQKIKTTLAEFLHKPRTNPLENITFYKTDWKAAKIFFEEKRTRVKHDIDLLSGETNSFPLDPEDCYLTTEINKYPGRESKNRKKYIEEYGLGGQKVWLHKQPNSNEIVVEMTNEPTADIFPWNGGSIDAPIVMLEDPYSNSLLPPPLGLYVIGFDDAKHDKTDGDSLLSATVFKRDYEGGEWANRIVAYYDSRPEKKKDYYKNLYLLMKYYNARVLFENEDSGYIEFLENYYMSDVFTHISESIGMASQDNLQVNRNRNWGLPATMHNIYIWEQRVVQYTKEDNVVIGEEQNLSGIDRINHPMLLEELFRYKKGGNFDRIRSFSLAITLARYYDNTYQYMKTRKKIQTDEEVQQSWQQKPKPNNYKGLTYTNKLKKW